MEALATIFENPGIIAFDGAIYTFFDGLRSAVMDVLMTCITYLGDDGIFWLVLTAILMIPKKTRKLGLYILFGLGVATVINNLGLKELFARPRPFNFEHWGDIYEYVYPNLVEKPHSLSFPSGHTSTSIGAALPFLMRANKKAGIPIFIIAVLIGISRIYIHVHYPTDVIAGAVVGLVSGFLAVLLLDKLIFPKVIPAIEKKLNKKIISE